MTGHEPECVVPKLLRDEPDLSADMQTAWCECALIRRVQERVRAERSNRLDADTAREAYRNGYNDAMMGKAQADWLFGSSKPVANPKRAGHVITPTNQETTPHGPTGGI